MAQMVQTTNDGNYKWKEEIDLIILRKILKEQTIHSYNEVDFSEILLNISKRREKI